MKCGKCSAEPRLIQYQTFSYYYCDACKVEVVAPVSVEAIDIEEVPDHIGSILYNPYWAAIMQAIGKK
jgi:hypothetical protein